MAKKTKKRSVSTPTTPVKSSAAVSSGTKSSVAYSTEFNPDYGYVKKDLKRIGLLAGSFFVVLVVLSFFLR